MSEKRKEWTLEEILQLADPKKDVIIPVPEYRYVAINRVSTDYEGFYIHRLFQKTDGLYLELDVQELKEVVADFLAKNVNAKRLLKDVLEKESAAKLIELYMKIVGEQPKVTVGVQKGSCYFLYVGGKEKGIALQLTE